MLPPGTPGPSQSPSDGACQLKGGPPAPCSRASRTPVWLSPRTPGLPRPVPPGRPAARAARPSLHARGGASPPGRPAARGIPEGVPSAAGGAPYLRVCTLGLYLPLFLFLKSEFIVARGGGGAPRASGERRRAGGGDGRPSAARRRRRETTREGRGARRPRAPGSLPGEVALTSPGRGLQGRWASALDPARASAAPAAAEGGASVQAGPRPSPWPAGRAGARSESLRSWPGAPLAEGPSLLLRRPGPSAVPSPWLTPRWAPHTRVADAVWVSGPWIAGE